MSTSDGVRKSKGLYLLPLFISMPSIFQKTVGLALLAVYIDHPEHCHMMDITVVIKLSFPLSTHRFEGRSTSPKPHEKFKNYHENKMVTHTNPFWTWVSKFTQPLMPRNIFNFWLHLKWEIDCSILVLIRNWNFRKNKQNLEDRVHLTQVRSLPVTWGLFPQLCKHGKLSFGGFGTLQELASRTIEFTTLLGDTWEGIGCTPED